MLFFKVCLTPGRTSKERGSSKLNKSRSNSSSRMGRVRATLAMTTTTTRILLIPTPIPFSATFAKNLIPPNKLRNTLSFTTWTDHNLLEESSWPAREGLHCQEVSKKVTVRTRTYVFQLIFAARL